MRIALLGAHHDHRHVSATVRLLLAAALLLFLAGALKGQPFNAWGVWNGTSRYIEIPHTADLNPISAITIELWVSFTPPAGGGEQCKSLFGKNFLETYWVGICFGNTLRSYVKGSGSAKNGGIVPASQWTHIAVTYDGVNRVHYINGEVAAVFPDTGPLPSSGANLRIGSDAAFPQSPTGAIDEVRLWSIARSVEQIRGSINVPISSAQPGLVAVWALDANGNDAVGGHNGANVGGLPFLTFPVTLNCGSSSATTACLNTRFAVSIQFRDPNTGVTSNAQLVNCPNPDSALFWFFAPNAWEVMVKTINGCDFNTRYWAFSAATTNVFYRLNVADVRGGANKIYFNYFGPPAAAVTDTAAFATCP